MLVEAACLLIRSPALQQHISEQQALRSWLASCGAMCKVSSNLQVKTSPVLLHQWFLSIPLQLPGYPLH
jgi:hypothetical protein